jgi:hypothetical protein
LEEIMRHTLVLAALCIGIITFGSGVHAQCNAPNISATLAYANVPIGKDLIVNFVTPRMMNGKFIYTLCSPYEGVTPIGGGFCLPLAPPFSLLGASYIAANKARFRFTIPNDASLVGLNLHLA